MLSNSYSLKAEKVSKLYRAHKVELDAISYFLKLGFGSRKLTNRPVKEILALDQIAFIGNDINDISALKIVGLPIAVSDAYPEIKKYTLYTTKKSGGYGAVREVCDLICEVKSNKRINS
jgi:YrbI family 3-deoxy-D-manno-octulosonate 8-phosphate phosphatase